MTAPTDPRLELVGLGRDAPTRGLPLEAGPPRPDLAEAAWGTLTIRSPPRPASAAAGAWATLPRPPRRALAGALARSPPAQEPAP